MAGDEIRVNWRAVIVPASGTRPLHGRLRKLSRNRITVSADHNLMPGHRCELAVLLPKDSPEVPNRYLEGSGVVLSTVLSAMEFHITVEWKALRANGEQMLAEQIRLHGQRWKSEY